MFSVQDNETDIDDGNMSSEGFRGIIEDHLSYFRTQDSTLVSLDPHLEYVYTGDFYGLLTAMGIKMALHWIILRVNGYSSPIDYDGQLGIMIQPQKYRLDLLLARYLSSFTMV